MIVDQDTPGLEFGPQERLMGFRGIGTADMFFNEVRIPKENLLVAEGGFSKLFTAFSIERLGNATMALAIGQTALDRSTRYVQERRQFGRRIAEFQLVQATIADMVMQVEAARLLIHRAAVSAGREAPRHWRHRSPSVLPTRWPSGCRTWGSSCTAGTDTRWSSTWNGFTEMPMVGPSRAAPPISSG